MTRVSFSLEGRCPSRPPRQGIESPAPPFVASLKPTAVASVASLEREGRAKGACLPKPVPARRSGQKQGAAPPDLPVMNEQRGAAPLNPRQGHDALASPFGPDRRAVARAGGVRAATFSCGQASPVRRQPLRGSAPQTLRKRGLSRTFLILRNGEGKRSPSL